MKILHTILGLSMMYAAAVNADELSKEQPREAKLYNFNEELIAAVENCALYQTDFSLKDTPYASLGDFAGKMPSRSTFEIYHKDRNICRMRVRIAALGKGETRFNCRLNDEQRALMVKAMRDKSTEEYVITLPTENEADCSGCSSAVTFSGNLFDTTLAMLKPKVCAELHILPTTEDIEAARALKRKFAQEFRNALAQCTPVKATDANQALFDGLEIIGMTEDKNQKCRLKYADFEMSIRPGEAQRLFSLDDLQRILLRDLDDAKYDYEAKYDETGILFGLDACRQKGGFYDAGENIFTHGNIQARNGLNAKRVDETCRVVLKNTVQIANIYHRDYSMQCNVPVIQIAPLTALYQHLLDETGTQSEQDKNGVSYFTEARHTPETRKADEVIMAKIRELGYCFAKLPIDPIKVERDDFTYSNSLPMK